MYYDATDVDQQRNNATTSSVTHGVTANPRKMSRTSESLSDKEKQTLEPDIAIFSKDNEEVEEARERRHFTYQKYRPFVLGGTALVILGWWISATILKDTRHRW
jgi:concentrative nucleoside transporter, CNT family